MSAKRFNLRVYGLLINEHNEVLLSDECRKGFAFTKFPGGGLQWGEGIINCLQRELREELGVDATIGELFYLTDFFQQSAFAENDQLISVYYHVHVPDWRVISCKPKPEIDDYEVFRWVKLEELSEDQLTFPVDKMVGRKLCGGD
ncbi:MAG TPA: NUDIX hydrolase [Fluviicola sp.]|nr:NUDIX hydrolase [Fluviicola sp.]